MKLHLITTCKADTKYLNNQKLLDDLRKSLRLDEILITDENSEVTASSSINGSNKNPCVHVYEFASGIYQTDYKRYLEPLYCDRHKAVLQYTGVSRKDKHGIVIIAKKSENIASIIKSNITSELSSIYPIYKNGFIAIIDKDTHTIISYKDNRNLGVDIKELGIDINGCSIMKMIKLKKLLRVLWILRLILWKLLEIQMQHIVL